VKVPHGRTTESKGAIVVHEEFFLHGARHGTSTFYFDSGLPAFQTTFEQGVESGMRLRWNSSGILTMAENLRLGKREGMSFRWSDNGAISEECSYRDDKLNGTLIAWHSKPAALPWYIKEYQDGVQNGYERWWDESGKLISEQLFVNGKVVEE